MPDDLHFFCSPATDPESALEKWMTLWRNEVTRGWQRRNELPFWQRDFWDRQLRRGDSYSSKLGYVRENPVRHRLVKRLEDWPYQGELNELAWHD